MKLFGCFDVFGNGVCFNLGCYSLDEVDDWSGRWYGVDEGFVDFDIVDWKLCDIS